MTWKLQRLPGSPDLAYRRGPRNGPTLVLLHGVARLSEDFEKFSGRLRGFWDVVALDFRGHGDSDRTPGQYLVTDYVRDAVRLLRHLGSEPVVLLGHSLGAMVALAAAAECPERVRTLVLEDPPFHTMGQRIAATSWQSLFCAMRDIARKGQTEKRMAEALAAVELFDQTKATPVRLGQVRSRESLRFSARCLARLDPEVFTPLIEGRWLDGYEAADLARRVACPVLIAQGDPAAGGALTDEDASELQSTLARGQVIRFPGSGHLIHGEQPAALRCALQEFMFLEVESRGKTSPLESSAADPSMGPLSSDSVIQPNS